MGAVMGIDTGKVHLTFFDKKEGRQKSFTNLVGAAVSSNDYISFKEAYSTAISKTLDECGLTKNKEIYSNYDFTMIYNQTGKPIHQIFFKYISPNITSLNVFYTLIPKNATMLAWKGLKQQGRTLSKERLNFEETLGYLFNGFPLFCAWRIAEFIHSNNFEVLLDHFTYKTCKAWKQVSHLNLHVLPSGDKSNPLIATADIILQLIELRRSKAKLWYNYGTFRKLFPELNQKIFEYSINQGHYGSIYPYDNKNLILSNKLKHPLIFVIKDPNNDISTESLKNDKSMNPIFDLAHAVDGGVKFYNRDEDLKNIHDGDFVIYFSERGKQTAQMLSKIRKNIKTIEYDTLVSCPNQN